MDWFKGTFWSTPPSLVNLKINLKINHVNPPWCKLVKQSCGYTSHDIPYTFIYIYTYIHTYIHSQIGMTIERERERVLVIVILIAIVVTITITIILNISDHTYIYI